jgi:hypothetical protein
MIWIFTYVECGSFMIWTFTYMESVSSQLEYIYVERCSSMGLVKTPESGSPDRGGRYRLGNTKN